MHATRILLALLVVLAAPACGFAADLPAGARIAPPALVRHVGAFLKPGLALDHAYVAPSRARRNARFLAARIVGARSAWYEGTHTFYTVGVWLVSGPADSPGLTLSVNAYAREFSLAPDGSRTNPGVTMLEPPAAELQRYVESRIR